MSSCPSLRVTLLRWQSHDNQPNQPEPTTEVDHHPGNGADRPWYRPMSLQGTPGTSGTSPKPAADRPVHVPRLISPATHATCANAQAYAASANAATNLSISHRKEDPERIQTLRERHPVLEL
ncbi:hypothetical protein M409DRAFT_51576 [Zasmidium cellare ATCC 36951]|uniref:Uncharacterized protein n=1 Tax=Zasmidium cellare ATCC 36951 TaxID=1080233 RepID=A0A6A6CV13_ZASCE|nr:uncharacterized protein M409DRAFT_51576 [Zasmidium cellare ATCC 36951]KAF2170553.1 hypothetical protein M409DRAFT_51576 [Zasmidium cellare ATCC 36951]